MFGAEIKFIKIEKQSCEKTVNAVCLNHGDEVFLFLRRALCVHSTASLTLGLLDLENYVSLLFELEYLLSVSKHFSLCNIPVCMRCLGRYTK